MGGKQKQAHRTKNNARPSSSGRSAELLGSSMQNFMGFSAVKEGSFMPVISGLGGIGTLQEESEINLDGSFQLVFKKMNKKDATTKLKALQEFSELVTSSEVEAVKTILPFWPRLYFHLATDVEHRVREAAQVAQGAVATKVGRNLAPFLKQLAPAWLTAQYDTYAPAASAATQSFQQAFPSNKLPDVILFCQEEILAYICDNITIHTAQTLSNPKTTTPEDAEARYERVVVCSLHGYTLYLHSIANEHLVTPHQINTKIITSGRFWKLAKHKVPSVRSAWYKTLSAVCTRAPVLLDSEGPHLVSTVLANLDETDPAVLPSVWEAALLTFSAVKEWWTHVNLEKVVLPNLWRVLKAGGHGCATSIYPHLLPLLAHFPPGKEPLLFYSKFFENMHAGLSNKSVLQSRSEQNAVCFAFIECLKYIILKNQTSEEMCETLVTEQLTPAIQWCLTQGSFTGKVMFKQVSGLVQYWSRNRDKKEYPLYGKLIECYWNGLNTLINNTLNTIKDEYDPDVVSKTTGSLLELLLCSKVGKQMKTKQNLKVKFTSFDKESHHDQTDSVTMAKPEIDIKYQKELNNLVYKTIKIMVAQATIKENQSLITQIYSLVLEFESEEMFASLSTESNQVGAIGFYKDVLNKWVNSFSMCSQDVLDLCFVLFKYISEDDKIYVLNTLLQSSHPSVLLWSVSRCLSHPICKESCVREWLKRDEVSAYLIALAKQAVANTDMSSNISILKQCFMQNNEEDIMISKNTIAEIVSIISASLNTQSETLDSCASFASELAAILYSDSSAVDCGNSLLLSLFALSLRFNGHNEYFSCDTLWEVNTAWQDAIGYFTRDDDALQELAKDCATVVQECLFNSDVVEDTLMVAVIEAVVSFIKAVVDNSESTTGEMKSDIVTKISLIFFSRPKPLFDFHKINLVNICLRAEIISGNISCLHENESSAVERLASNTFDKEDHCFGALMYLRWSYFTLNILQKLFDPLLEELDKEENGEDLAEGDKKIVKEKPAAMLQTLDEDLQEIVMNVIYSVALAESVGTHFEYTKLYKVIFKLGAILNNNLQSFLRNIPADVFFKLAQKLRSVARQEGCMWATAVYIFDTELNSSNECRTPIQQFKHTNTERSPSPTFDKDNIFKVCIQGETSASMEFGWLHIFQKFSSDLSGYSITIDYPDEKWPAAWWNQAVVIRSLLRDNFTQQFHAHGVELLNTIIMKYKTDETLMLFNRDVSTQSWSSVMIVVETARLLETMIKNHTKLLSMTHWDFLRIALSSWTLSVAKSRHVFFDIKTATFISVVYDLFGCVTWTLDQNRKESNTGVPQELVTEWADLFAKDVNLVLLKSFLYISDEANKMQSQGLENETLLIRICNNMRNIDPNFVFHSNRIDSKTSINDFVDICLNLIRSPICCLRTTGYKMMKKFAGGFVKKDIETMTDSVNDSYAIILHKFETHLRQIEDIVTTMLSEFRLGEDSCTVELYTDSYTFTMSYLLTWNVILNIISLAPSELRYQYANWLSQAGFINKLMENVFRLLPEEALHCQDSKSPRMRVMFTEEADLGIRSNYSWNRDIRLEHLVCTVYCNSLRQLPALVRQWWSDAETKVANTVEKITECFVSPLLCNEEMKAVLKQQKKDDNMQVRVHASAREVVAVYTVDEARMELLISLPPNHPLGLVRVTSGKQIGGTTQWRTWMMQLTIFLTHQNGSIWDGLSMWKSNLDRRFEGVEECYVCYSILHAGTYQLPKLSCQTCRKKFHSSCLYKWFSTSNKSTCPICRNVF